MGTGTDTTRNGPCMTMNGKLHVGFGAELQKYGLGEVKEQNVTRRGMKSERLESVVAMVVVLRS